MRRAAAALATLTLAPVAGACPVCSTEGGAEVRAGIFNPASLAILGELGVTVAVLGVAVFFVDGWLPK